MQTSQSSHASASSPHTKTAKTVEVFFDGECPLCLREINMLKRLDKKQRIEFTDISLPSFNANAVGIPWPTLMDRIHGRLADGTIIEGVEVFRQLYSAVGMSPIVALTRLPGIAQALNVGYKLFAKNRLKFTGRCVDGVCPVQPTATT